MPRTRTIKPEFWNDEKLARLSRESRLTFIGIWTMSDDYAVVKGNHRWLRSQIFPYDDIDLKTFSAWIKELEDSQRVISFMYHNETFYYIPGFEKHQKIDHPSKTSRNIPENEWPEIREQLLTGSRDPRESLASASRDPLDETETETEIKTEKEKEINKEKEISFQPEVWNLFALFKSLIDQKLWPKNGQQTNWLKAIDKCLTSYSYTPERLSEIIRYVHSPDNMFRCESPLKFTALDKVSKVRYIDKVNNAMKKDSHSGESIMERRIRERKEKENNERENWNDI